MNGFQEYEPWLSRRVAEVINMITMILCLIMPISFITVAIHFWNTGYSGTFMVLLFLGSIWIFPANSELSKYVEYELACDQALWITRLPDSSQQD